MQLQSLRPKTGLNLRQLHAMTERQGWRATLPASLPDAVLLELALVFRKVEKDLSRPMAPDAGDLALEVPLYLVTNLLGQHPVSGLGADAVTISEEGLLRAFQVYQWSLEREIAGRILGEQTGDETASLLEGLRKCLQN